MKVYDRLYPKVYSSAYYILGNKMDAEDIAQEAFLKAFKKIKSLIHANSLDAWITTIARNKALEELRKKSTVELDEGLTLEEETAYDWEQYQVTDILNGLLLLPNGFRTIMSLYLLEGLNHEEIAQELKITSSASRSQYSRGKRRLREILENK